MGLKAPLPALCRSEKEGSHDCLNLLVRTIFIFISFDDTGMMGTVETSTNMGTNLGSSGGNIEEFAVL